MTAFKSPDALQLAVDAEREGEHEIVALAKYLQVTHDETLNDTRRLMLLEDALRTLSDDRNASGDRASAALHFDVLTIGSSSTL